MIRTSELRDQGHLEASAAGKVAANGPRGRHATMQGSFEKPPIVVRSSIRTASWMLVAAAVFVGIAIAMLFDPHETHRLAAWACIVFFGSGIPVFAHRLLSPDTLEIGPRGLSWRILFRTGSLQWRDVGNFRAFRPAPRSGLHLGFEYAGDYRPHPALRRFAKGLSGVEGSLGGGWELRPAELADLLNAAHARWGPADRRKPAS